MTGAVEPSPAMKLRVVPARHGVLWVRSGFRIFFARPLAFGALFALFMFGVTLLLVLPLVGVLLVLTALPLVTQAFMVATRRALLDRPVLPDVYAEPLRAGRPRTVAMIQLGLAYAVTTLALMWLGGVVDGGAFAALEAAMVAGTPDPEQMAQLLGNPRLLAGMLVRLGSASLLSVPFWHAPPLVHWGGQGCVKSLFFSCVACWRNRGAFTLYALTWTALFLLFGLLANLVFAALGAPKLMALAAVPAGLMFSTVFYASLYFTFADCFDHRLQAEATDAASAG